MKTFDIGPIRPPSEAASLLLRVTHNCPWNKCRFCTLYKDEFHSEQFKTRPNADIMADIDAMAELRDIILMHFDGKKPNLDKLNAEYAKLNISQKECFSMAYTWIVAGGMKSMFLQDANSLVLQPERLAEVIAYAAKRLPELKRITAYGRADTLSRIPQEGFNALRSAGLNRIHSGFETGSDRVLALINKGATKAQEIEGGVKVRKAGIELSIYFMPGAGGKLLSDDNAMETADVINKIQPDFVRLRTFVVKEGSGMARLRDEGAFTDLDDIGKVRELKLMLENVSHENKGYIASDHIINLLEGVRGYMNKDLDSMLCYINEFLSLSPQLMREFQLARRLGFSGNWQQMDKLPPDRLSYIQNTAQRLVDEGEWNLMINEYLNMYI